MNLTDVTHTHLFTTNISTCDFVVAFVDARRVAVVVVVFVVADLGHTGIARV